MCNERQYLSQPMSTSVLAWNGLVDLQGILWLDGISKFYERVYIVKGLGSAFDVFNVGAGFGYHF